MNNLSGKFRLQSVIVIVCLALLPGACAPVSSPPEQAATEAPVHIKMGLQPFMGYAPLFIAQEEGYFAKHGLDVEFVPFNSASEAVPLVMQGQLDLTPVALNPGLFNAIASGGAGRIVLGLSQWRADGCTSTGVVARAADVDKFKDVANWKGLLIAIDPAGLPGMSGYLLNQALAQSGLSLNDVSTTKLPPASIAEALRSGAIALAQTTEPWITRLTAPGEAGLVLRAQDIVPDGQLSVIAFAPRLLQDLDLGRRAALAYSEGVGQYLAGKTDRNVEILAKYTQMEPDLVKQVCWPAITGDGSLNLAGIRAYQEWAISQGLLDKIIGPDQFLDSRFQGLLAHD